MGVEVALAVSAVAAATSTGIGVANYLASQDAAAAQEGLANQQRADLKRQADDRNTEAARMATTGQSFGRGDEGTKALSTGFGFGSAPASSANSGRAQITGGF